MKVDAKEAILFAISRYDYAYALKLAERAGKSTQSDLFRLLRALAERRELNIQSIMNLKLEITGMNPADFQLFCHENEADEQLANYLYDLDAKLRNEQLIDFVRAVSPAIYRVFMRLIRMQLPDIDSYIHNSREASYDRWKFEKMRNSDHPVLQNFHTESTVNSSSLTELILQLNFPESVKESAGQLRELEKSVRNPLAHLIKPFDEEELHRTTGFSSQHFMELLVDLAQETGIVYQREPFYFDRANAIVESLL
ncbi:hypothetical protein [Streptococcus gordonii]|uniref:Histidine protein kinase n=1 Tax=Streptococcus gordonii (strain Challis / ATCC 35105 / BCRC 15272 / CH1 / DL1 / V288) TaxID=467705 RepID=A8AXN3_STRGC|nr:hypothetical protein [Streptococcus gordonii]ABV11169.1 histidine protein kinase [Streptococcus gordonii str. Challis substr. CH1]MBZ2137324.1 hypothetical protein [Streptococcus gordonii]MCY7138730.1 hypothetical protein [Streptococcus gordonii]QGS43605.1 hypothetical protein FOB91_02330 [Streptococcus gordonii]VEE21692.1 histidine protein kinase [Streptococcus gordonii]